MQGWLFEEASIFAFVFVTIVLGGGGAWMTGRACALTWRPVRTLVVYILLLSVAVRFIHHSIFEGTFLSLQYYAVDAVILMAIGVLGYRFTRANQMVRQYYWLYEKSGPVAWKQKA